MVGGTSDGPKLQTKVFWDSLEWSYGFWVYIATQSNPTGSQLDYKSMNLLNVSALFENNNFFILVGLFSSFLLLERYDLEYFYIWYSFYVI